MTSKQEGAGFRGPRDRTNTLKGRQQVSTGGGRDVNKVLDKLMKITELELKKKASINDKVPSKCTEDEAGVSEAAELIL